MNIPFSKKYVFLHIPKSAGSTLFQVYRTALGPDNVRIIAENSISTHHLDLLDQATLVGGHITYRFIDQLFRDRYKITFLRHPVDRFISHYFYAKHNIALNYSVSSAKEMDFADYVDYYQSHKNDFSVLNTQVWFLSGIFDATFNETERLALAKKNLSSLDFIGIYEFFSDSINLLCYDCNWPPIYEIPVENKTVKRLTAAELNPQILNRIKELNSLDLELYEYGLSLFRHKKKQLLLECVRRNYHSVVSPASTETFTCSRENDQPKITPPGPEPIRQPQNFGTMVVKILGAYILGVDSEKRDIIAAGEEAVIYLFIYSSINVDNLTIGFSITDEIGQTVFETNSLHLKKILFVEKHRTYCVQFRMHMNIANGFYKINATTHIGPTHFDKCFHWQDDVSSFWVKEYRGFYFGGLAKLYPVLEVAEIVPMDALAPEQAALVNLEVVKPDRVLPLMEADFRIKLINRSDRIISSYMPYPVFISYHWLQPETQEIVELDGLRSVLIPPLPAEGQNEYRVTVLGPSKYGPHILRLTLVQEGLQWFDEQVKVDLLIDVGKITGRDEN